jgi:hypothetical protein
MTCVDNAFLITTPQRFYSEQLVRKSELSRVAVSIDNVTW